MKFRVESPFDENSENTHFCQEGPKFEGGTAGKFRVNGQQKEIQIIVSQPCKCLKFMTFREGCLVMRN